MVQFRNWTGNHECNAPIKRPTNHEALAEVVRRQASCGKVCVAGSGLSHAPLVSTSSEIVSTSALRRVLAFVPTGPEPYIEVEAGATVAEVNAIASAHRVVARQRPVYPDISVGGLLSTGSHGVGRDSGCFADGVLAVTVLDALGRPTTIERRDPRFDAASCALGGFGVIYSVRIGLVAETSIRMTVRYVEVETVLEALDDLVASHEGVEIFWSPHSHRCAVITFDAVESPTNDRPFGRLEQRVSELACIVAGDYVLPTLYAWSSRQAPWFNRASMYTLLRERSAIYRATDAYHFQPAIPRNHLDMSVAFPTERASAGFRLLMGRIRGAARDGQMPITFGLHARFVGAARPWLAPGHGRPTCHVDLVTSGSAIGANAFYVQIEEEVLDAFPDARLHWGKLHFQVERLAGRYPNLDDYRRARDAFDPDGVFVGPHLARVLGGEPRERAVGTPE